MLPRTLAAYIDEGFAMRLGTPRGKSSWVVDAASGRPFSSGGGLSVSDAFCFMVAATMLDCRAVFIIGNAVGISTLMLAEIFPQALIDAIDAEVEGEDNARGTEITRRIASRHFSNVHVTVGWSPNDLPKAMRSEVYDLAFVDGLHTNEQVVKDFLGLLPFMSDHSCIVLHDIAGADLNTGWQIIRSHASGSGFRAFDATFTQFGSGVLSRGNPDLERWLDLACESFVSVDPVNYGVHKGVSGLLDYSPRALAGRVYAWLLRSYRNSTPRRRRQSAAYPGPGLD